MTQSLTRSRPKALYLEDEIILALDVAEGLSSDLGFEVHMAHNLTSAYRLVQLHKFEFALLDMNLGNGERSTDLGHLLSEGGTCVIFASGYNRNEIDRIGGFQLIEKPFNIADIRRAFRSEQASH